MSMISVIMPVYNGEKYLREAINSILGQTYQDFEFIIINDCSADKTEDIIMSYTDERIKYFKNIENMGVAKTLNRGLELAKGTYIARMDADDISYEKRFEKQVDYLEKHPEVGVVGTCIKIFGEGIQEHDYSFPHQCSQAKADLIFNSSLAHPTVMIRKDALEKNAIRYEEKYEGLEDFVLWWRIACTQCVVSLPVVLLKYRKHISQVTKKRSEEFYLRFYEFIEERLSVFKTVCTNEQKKLFLKYCSGEHATFTINETKEFIVFLQHLLKANKKTKYFDGKSLQHVFGLASAYVIQNIDISCIQRIQLLWFGWKKHTISNMLFLKLMRYRIIELFNRSGKIEKQ